MALKVGDAAPDFVLKSATGETQGEFKLSDHKGKKVVLVFYALDFTPVCQSELPAFQGELTKFASLGSEVVGLSTDTVFSHIAFQREMGGLEFPLAADRWPYANTAQAYGIFPPSKHEIPFVNDRAIFIVGKDGKIAWAKVYELKEQPDVDEVLEALRGLA
ncbi:MAG TPA: redoxin domain-containing protein [Terriglobia bacterium]|nr:redoxin domain-containing protein [Terriglobia bacterium]